MVFASHVCYPNDAHKIELLQYKIPIGGRNNFSSANLVNLLLHPTIETHT